MSLLGVYIDSTFSGKEHIDNVCQQPTSKITLPKGILNFLSYDMKLMYYKAYIIPFFSVITALQYGIRANICVLTKEFLSQNEYVKLFYTDTKEALPLSRKEGLLVKMFYLTFCDRCKYNIALFAYKALHQNIY